MSVPQIDESGMDPMQRLPGSSGAPVPDRNATRAGFEDMMAAIAAMPVEVRARLADEADAIELGLDANELGSAYLERGDFERAERWLRVAARHRVAQAEQRLADLAELRQALAEIRNISADLSAMPAADGEGVVDTDAAPGFEDPYVEARRIIAEAERKAAGIVAAAKLRTRRPAPAANGQRVDTRPAKVTGTWWPLQAGAPLYVSTSLLSHGVDLDSARWRATREWTVWHTSGSGKSLSMARHLAQAKTTGHTIMVLIFDGVDTVSGRGTLAHPTQCSAWAPATGQWTAALNNTKVVGVGGVGSWQPATLLRGRGDRGFEADLIPLLRPRVHNGCTMYAVRDRGIQQASPLEDTVAAAVLQQLAAYCGIGRPPSIGDASLLVPTVRPGLCNDLYVDLVPHWPAAAGEPASAAPHDHVDHLQVQGK